MAHYTPLHPEVQVETTHQVLRNVPLTSESDFQFTRKDQQILRELAGQIAALAAQPVEQTKRDLWIRHNRLDRTRPLILCDPELAWQEIITDQQLRCQGNFARQWERQLRQERFWGNELQDDRSIEPFFILSHVRQWDLFWGLKETRIGGDNRTTYRWESPVRSEQDIDRLTMPTLEVDFAGTDRLATIASEIFGDLLPVKLRTMWWWTLGLTWMLINLRGLEQVMYDLVDNPDLIHRLMALLRDGTAAFLDDLEARNLLFANTGGTTVASGGMGWSDELPRQGGQDHQGHIQPAAMWGFAESQETVGVSPLMFAEFVFPYQQPLLERFGLNCYGCCEPLEGRWHVVQQIPRLRRVSVSPFSDRAAMADRLQNRYIYSMKPHPADLAMPSFDEDRIRQTLRRDLRITRDCRLEIILKDTTTICNQPERLVRWVQIAREEVERL
ncbi:MAG: hypothetical protein U9R25_07370 [Chloroflexota bacterium]|nr:hypothetical protein [Chloroflexota bacterium]